MRPLVLIALAWATASAAPALAACPSGTFGVELTTFESRMREAGHPVELHPTCHTDMPGCSVTLVGTDDLLYLTAREGCPGILVAAVDRGGDPIASRRATADLARVLLSAIGADASDEARADDLARADTTPPQTYLDGPAGMDLTGVRCCSVRTSMGPQGVNLHIRARPTSPTS